MSLPRSALVSLIAIVLASCGNYPERSNFTSNEHDEITDIADSSASSAIEDSEKIDELEARLAEVERRLEEHGR